MVISIFHDNFLLVLCDGWGTLPKCRVDLAITSSQAPYFENATNRRALPYTFARKYQRLANSWIWVQKVPKDQGHRRGGEKEEGVSHEYCDIRGGEKQEVMTSCCIGQFNTPLVGSQHTLQWFHDFLLHVIASDILFKRAAKERVKREVNYV